MHYIPRVSNLSNHFGADKRSLLRLKDRAAALLFHRPCAYMQQLPKNLEALDYAVVFSRNLSGKWHPPPLLAAAVRRLQKGTFRHPFYQRSLDRIKPGDGGFFTDSGITPGDKPWKNKAILRSSSAPSLLTI